VNEERGELGQAFHLLGLAPGVSPFRARARYRELARQWHPDRCSGDPAAQRTATHKMQAINAAYERIKESGTRGELPVRPTRSTASPTTGPVPRSVSVVLQERLFNFVIGAIVGLVLDFSLLSNSAALWISVPLAVGAITAAWGTGVLVWALRKLWWLA
jgi:hypothetical protein